jgi:hypothetical protein
MVDKAPKVPESLREMIENNTFKDQPEEFKNLILASLKAVALGEISPGVAAASDFIRKELEKSFEIGKAANLLCHRVEEYVGCAH